MSTVNLGGCLGVSGLSVYVLSGWKAVTCVFKVCSVLERLGGRCLIREFCASTLSRDVSLSGSPTFSSFQVMGVSRGVRYRSGPYLG